MEEYKTLHEITPAEWSKFVMAWTRAVEEAWKDPSFAEALRRDPLAALKTLGYDYSKELPLDLQITVGDAYKMSLTLKIPDKGDVDRLACEQVALSSMYFMVCKLC